MDKKIIIGIIIGLMLLCIVTAYEPTFHFWKSEYQKNIGWCIKHKPSMNISNSFCFNEGWVEYCKYSYPEYCPNNNYTDYERCLKNCIIYGNKKCPC